MPGPLYQGPIQCPRSYLEPRNI